MSSVHFASKCSRVGLLGFRLTNNTGRRSLASLGPRVVSHQLKTAATSSIRQLSACQHGRQPATLIERTALQPLSLAARKLSTNVKDELKPFVAAPYSYAYGRSDYSLSYKTIGRLLEDMAKEEPNVTVITVHHEGITKTASEFNADVNRMANCLYQNVNIRRGDVVGLWSCNTYNWIVIQYAIARLGAILCTINPYYQASELEHVLRMGDIKALFLPGKGSQQEVVNKFLPKLNESIAKKDEPGMEPIRLEHVITLDGEPFKKKYIPSHRDITLHTMAELDGCSTEFDDSISDQVVPDDPAIILFTSGTTGKPKGAYLSHFTLTNNSILASKHLAAEEAAKIFCVPLPFFHSFAAVLGNISMSAARIPIVVPYLRHDVKQLAEAMIEHKVTHLMATPTLAIDLLFHLQKIKKTIPTLASVLAGGASMPIEIAHQFVDTVKTCTGFRIGYGATETGPCSTSCRINDTFEQRTETVGTPLDFVEVKVVNPTTRELVRLNDVGEVHVRGHNIMLGYWKEPEKTAECIDRAGWYNTGDLGSMDENGFLKIHGRTKELIIVGGENVHPLEVEELLHTHPDIANVYVVGVPDARKGEAICAWVELANPKAKVTEEDLKKFCQDRITYFKVPTYFMFVKEFPMTSTGKAQKFRMREISIEKLKLKK